MVKNVYTNKELGAGLNEWHTRERPNKWRSVHGCTYPNICMVGMLGCGEADDVHIETGEWSAQKVRV